MAEYSKALSSAPTPIPGLTVWELPVHGDNRGWFKENWQRDVMTEAGLPDFGPVQQNISYNEPAGTTRGLHAEPWDKWVSVATGSVFGVWVDLRDGPTYGTIHTELIDPTRAVFVPRGVANGFQTLEDATAYTYLVNDHWSPDAEYPLVNLADPTLAIDWPIPLDRATISEKDLNHPPLAAATPVTPPRVLVIGARGQLGRALRSLWGDRQHIEYVDSDELDLTTVDERSRPWSNYAAIVNAAGYTQVDAAQGPEGRQHAWAANAVGPARLANVARTHRLTLVHVSTDYVFDGETERAYREDDALSPLSVYGQSKAAGDLAAAGAPRHYIVRTSWLVGDGSNFVSTMATLATDGKEPAVVNDQYGRPTFASDLARAIDHLLSSGAPYGLYNVSNAGDEISWHGLARSVFETLGHDPSRVREVSTADYYASAKTEPAPRPRRGTLALDKIIATGFTPPAWPDRLRDHLGK